MSNYDQLHLLEEPSVNPLTKTAVQYYNSCIKEKELTTTAIHLVSGHLSEEQHNILSAMVEEVVAPDISTAILNLNKWSFNPRNQDDELYAHVMLSDFQMLLNVLNFYKHPSYELLQSIFDNKKQQEESND